MSKRSTYGRSYRRDARKPSERSKLKDIGALHGGAGANTGIPYMNIAYLVNECTTALAQNDTVLLSTS